MIQENLKKPFWNNLCSIITAVKFQCCYPLQWNFYSLSPYTLFSWKYSSFFLVPRNCLYKQCIITLDTFFLELSFYSVSRSEFLVLTYNIPGMFIFENCAINMMFLAHTIAVSCPYLVLLQAYFSQGRNV